MPEATEEYDVVIIGAGVAGALVAATLATEGRSVVVLEAGAPLDPTASPHSSALVDEGRLGAVGRWSASHAKTLTTPYRDPLGERYAPFPDSSRDYLLAGPDRFKSTYLRRTGGSTWHWLGHTPRLLPSDFRMASQYGVGVDWPLDYDGLEPWYVEAERELGVAGDHAAWDGFCGAHRSASFPMPPIWPSWSDRQLAERIRGLDIEGRPVVIRPIPQARNSRPYQDRPPCAGNSSCIPICPIGAKYDATVHLRRAKAGGAQLWERTVATRIVFEKDRVDHIEIARWDESGSTPGQVRGRIYVVAAHAIESARLLLNSGLVDRSGMLGRNLMDHLTGQVVGLSPEPWYPFRGPPVTSGIDEWRDGAQRARHAAWKASLGNDGFGRFQTPEAFVQDAMAAGSFGADLRERIESVGPRMFRISFAAEQLPCPENRLEPSGLKDALGVPLMRIHYRVGQYTRSAFPEARTTLLRVFHRAGITQARLDPPGEYGGSGHVLGTCRMAEKAEDGVVDRDGRSFAAPNLFVVGSATFPTVGTANPTLTMAALALRTASILNAALGGQP